MKATIKFTMADAIVGKNVIWVEMAEDEYLYEKEQYAMKTIPVL